MTIYTVPGCKNLLYLTKTLRAPSGVTMVAGAKAYAAKLANSPKITGKENKNPLHSDLYPLE